MPSCTHTAALVADALRSWLCLAGLQYAGKPDKPGLYVNRACAAYWWATVSYLARDTKRVEDVDSSGPDHGADACRYGLSEAPKAEVFQLRL